MSDREKVINCIKYCINHPLCIDCDACDYGGESSVICDRLIQDTLALLKEQPQWVSVKDRMPEIGQNVLVYAVGRIDGFIGDSIIEICKRYMMRLFPSAPEHEVWSIPFPYFHTDYAITHWMPLPEPPKEVSE